MGLITGLDAAIKSMRAHTTAINTTAHNIANINTEGYSKQLTAISTTMPIDNPNGAGQLGTGSYVSNVYSTRDVFLDRQIRAEITNQGEWGITADVYKNLAALFTEIDSPSLGIASQIEKFWQGWDDLAAEFSKPVGSQDILGKQNAVFSAASGLADMFRNRSQELTALQINLNSQLNDTAVEANGYIREIASYNRSIIAIEGQGNNANDIRDKRILALKNLAELTNYNVNEQVNGAVSVTLGGKILIDSSNYAQFATMGNEEYDYSVPGSVPASKDSKLEQLGLIPMGGGSPVDITDSVTGGKMAGIINGRDTIVAGIRSELDIYVSSLITMVNMVHTTGVDSGGVQQNMVFFIGDRAANMALNQNLDGGSEIKTDLFQSGDLAKILAGLEDKVMTNVIKRETETALTTNTPGVDGVLVINGLSIAYSSTDTLEDIINNINSYSTEISAVFDAANNQFYMIGNDYMTIEDYAVYDSTGVVKHTYGDNHFLEWLQLAQGQKSGAAIAYAGSSFLGDSRIDGNDIFVNNLYKLDVAPDLSGEMSFTHNGVNYLHPYTLDAVTLPATDPTLRIRDVATGVAPLTMKTPTAGPLYFSLSGVYDSNTQKYEFFSSRNGDSDTDPLRYQLLPAAISDKTGNMTDAMKLIGNKHFGEFYDSIVATVKSGVVSAVNIGSQYEQTVESLEGLQAEKSSVDLAEELAKAKLYQRAYEASVRLMAVIDEMLNMLINRTGTPSSSSQS